jgi:hypothetical protein
MKLSNKFCLLGQVLIDVTLNNQSENKLRLGGVMHAARALWALDIDYTLAYVAPDYLAPLVEDYASQMGASRISQLGRITGSPNVILISEATEAGSQGYELLLRESANGEIDVSVLNEVSADDYSDILILPGGFKLETILESISRNTATNSGGAAHLLGRCV